jgi:glycosyltransferase involved in cell wall biosynthesis
MTLKRHYVVAGWTLGTGPSGATRRLASCLRELPALLTPGERVTVLVARGGPTPDLALRVEPIDIRPGPTWRRAFAERRLLRRALEHLGADLLDLGTLPVPRDPPCPVVLTLHDLRDQRPDLARRPRWISRRVLRAGVRAARRVVVPSAFTAGELRQTLGNLLPPLDVVPNGVDEQLLNLEPRAPLGRPYFLHVGHLEARKNLMMLLSAYATVLESAPDGAERMPALVLAGRDAGMRDALRERAAMLDLVPHLHFEGEVPEPHLRALYAGATAVLVPSRYEGFGLPALEGLAVGVPTLCAAAGALPEVVGHAAVVLPPDDPQAWATAMAAAIAEGRDPQAIAGRKAHAAGWTWRHATQALLEVWRAASEPTG